MQANARAKDIVARMDALAISRERLRALGTADDDKLQKLVERAANSDETEAMLVQRRFGGRDYLLLANPVARGDDACDGGTAAVRIRIVDPDEASAPSPEWLKRLFGLTTAETRLALELLAGRTSAEAAVALGISAATSRVHLAHVFRKTRTTRQTELVRLLMSYPWDELAAARPDNPGI
jgi:DNA-binding CsgD family transcriptional regulator